MTSKPTKILIAGEGGQGIQTMAKILTLALEKTDNYVSYIPQFGPEQRGTPSVAFIQYSERPINYPKFKTADFAIILRKRALPKIIQYLGPETEIIFDSSTIPRTLIQQKSSKVWGLPATKISEEKFLPKALNILVLSAFARHFLSFPQNALWEIVESILGSKLLADEKRITKEAFEFGQTIQFENKKYSRATHDVTTGIIVKKNSERQAVIVPKFCKGCGICILKCPTKALSFGENLGVYGTAVPEIDIEKCIACGNCFRFCPDSAIKVEKK